MNADSQPANWHNFGDAIEYLKKGKRICREGWHGKGMYVFLRHSENVESRYYEREMVLKLPEYPNGMTTYQPGWNASTADVLAEDWILLGDEESK